MKPPVALQGGGRQTYSMCAKSHPGLTSTVIPGPARSPESRQRGIRSGPDSAFAPDGAPRNDRGEWPARAAARSPESRQRGICSGLESGFAPYGAPRNDRGERPERASDFRKPVEIRLQHVTLEHETGELALTQDLDQARGLEFFDVMRERG